MRLESTMTWNGYARPATQSTRLLSVSGIVIQLQRFIPAPALMHHASADQFARASARLRCWRHMETDAIIRRAAQVATAADAGRRIGSLLIMAFTVATLTAAAAIIHHEGRGELREYQQR